MGFTVWVENKNRVRRRGLPNSVAEDTVWGELLSEEPLPPPPYGPLMPNFPSIKRRQGNPI